MRTFGITALRLLASAVALAASVATSAAPAQDRPNILVIWGDDVGWFNISAYNMGIMGYRTPNIDRIAGEGAPTSSASGPMTACPESVASTWASTRRRGAAGPW